MSVEVEKAFGGLLERQEVFATREEWLLARRSGVGASESAALFGVGYAGQSRVTVYESKLINGQKPKDLEDDPAMARRLRIGKQMEPVLRQIFKDETGFPVMDPGEFTIWRHPANEFMYATLDGVCWSPDFGGWGIVELKNVSNFNRAEWMDDDNPPLKYAVQCQHQMAVTGFPVAYLLGLVGGNEPVVKVIERNDRFIESTLIPKIAEFWDCVIEERLPEIDSSEATSKALGRLFSKVDEEEAALPVEATDWDLELQTLKAELKAKEERKQLLENLLKATIGRAAVGVLSSGAKYSYRSQTRKGFTVEPITFRVLRRESNKVAK